MSETQPVPIEKLESAIRLVERLVVQDGSVHLYLLNRLKEKLQARRSKDAAASAAHHE